METIGISSLRDRMEDKRLSLLTENDTSLSTPGQVKDAITELNKGNTAIIRASGAVIADTCMSEREGQFEGEYEVAGLRVTPKVIPKSGGTVTIEFSVKPII